MSDEGEFLSAYSAIAGAVRQNDKRLVSSIANELYRGADAWSFDDELDSFGASKQRWRYAPGSTDFTIGTPYFLRRPVPLEVNRLQSRVHVSITDGGSGSTWKFRLYSMNQRPGKSQTTLTATPSASTFASDNTADATVSLSASETYERWVDLGTCVPERDDNVLSYLALAMDISTATADGGTLTINAWTVEGLSAEETGPATSVTLGG